MPSGDTPCHANVAGSWHCAVWAHCTPPSLRHPKGSRTRAATVRGDPPLGSRMSATCTWIAPGGRGCGEPATGADGDGGGGAVWPPVGVLVEVEFSAAGPGADEQAAATNSARSKARRETFMVITRKSLLEPAGGSQGDVSDARAEPHQTAS